MNISDYSDSELELELARRKAFQDELQSRIYRGEIEVTDGDDIGEKYGRHSHFKPSEY